MKILIICSTTFYDKIKPIEEELKKFKPCLEVEDIEEAVYQEDLTDMTDLLKELQKK